MPKARQNVKVKLRALEPGDIDLIYKWENDPEIWRISNTYTPFSRYILEKYIESSHLDIYQVKQMRLIIEIQGKTPGKSRAVGTIDLFDFDPYHNRAGVGILVGEKPDRKKGYASAALKEFTNYCFKVLQLHQIYCNVVPANEDSLRLFKKHGFKVCGRKKDWIRTPGNYVDEYMLQLINPDDSGTL
jgi:diamine N-acetyltransferase